MSKPDIIIELPTSTGDIAGYCLDYSHTRLPNGEWKRQGCTGFVGKQLLTEIARLQAESEWQPFKTAPTDGTCILVYREDFGVLFAESDSRELDFSKPTHWKPLPKVPGQT